MTNRTRDFVNYSPFRGVIEFQVGRDTFRAVREGVAVGIYHKAGGAFVRILTAQCPLRPRAVYAVVQGEN